MKRNILWTSLMLSLFVINVANAKVEFLKPSKLFTDSIIKADMSFGNTWLNAVSGSNDPYTSTLDYRYESWTPLVDIDGHKAYGVVRLEGLSFFDDDVRFFDDRLIDIPELFLVTASKVGGSDFDFVFGKFAHRRFIDKDEIIRDPFDIGERNYFGDWTGSNNLLALVGEGREGGGRYTSKIARGNYGFALALKDRDGDTFFDRWGVKQAFVAINMNDLDDTFWGASEINKNWGDKNPGQMNIGLIWAHDNALGAVHDTMGYIPFFTLIQKIDSTAGYFRYAVLNSSLAGNDFSINSLQGGIQQDIGEGDILSLDYLHENAEGSVLGLDATNLYSINWNHKFSKNFNANAFLGFGTNALNAVTRVPGTNDNKWMIGFNLNAVY